MLLEWLKHCFPRHVIPSVMRLTSSDGLRLRVLSGMFTVVDYLTMWYLEHVIEASAAMEIY